MIPKCCKSCEAINVWSNAAYGWMIEHHPGAVCRPEFFMSAKMINKCPNFSPVVDDKQEQIPGIRELFMKNYKLVIEDD